MSYSFPSEENKQTWRTSLRKSVQPSLDFRKLANSRKAAVDQVKPELFCYKGVSLAFLNKFWRSVRNKERYAGVELYTTSVEAEGVPTGATVSKVESLNVDGENIKFRCFHPGTGNFITLWGSQVKEKHRKYWTVEDLCQFGLIPDTDLTNAPYARRLDNGACLGRDFEGKYVVYPRDCCFEDLLISFRNYVGDLGTNPAEDSYFWLDIFCTNSAMIQHYEDEAEVEAGSEEREEFFKTLTDFTKTAINLFDQRFIYFDNWHTPRVLNRLWCVWEISEIFKPDLSFEVLVEKQTASNFVSVYDTDDKGVFGVIEAMDPTVLNFENEQNREFLINFLTNNSEGFSTVKKLLKKKFSRWFVKEVEDDVKNFPDGGDHIGMEKFAIFLYKTGNYLRKHGEVYVAKCYFNKALEYYEDLQEYNREALERVPEGELTLQDQLTFDRINGGASKTNLYLGLISIKDSQFELASRYLERAENEAKKIRTQKHAFFVDISEAKAELYTKKGNLKGAIDELTAMTYVLKDDPDANRVKYGDLEYQLGLKYKELKENVKAAAAFKRAKDIQEKVLGQNHIAYARSLIAEASLHFRERNQKEAISNYNEALQILLKVVGSMNVEVGKVYSNLGQCYARQGKDDFNSALACYRKAIETFSFATGPYSMSIASAKNFEGVILKEMRNYDGAEKALQAAIDVLLEEEKLREKNEVYQTQAEKVRWKGLLANIHSNLGQTFEANRKKRKARMSYQACYEITKELVGPDDEKAKVRFQRWQRLKA